MAFVETKLPCPVDGCGSSDAYCIDEDGWGHCFSCDSNVPPASNVYSKGTNMKGFETDVAKVMGNKYPAAMDRCMLSSTMLKYQVATDGEDYLFPYFDSNNEVVAIKTRHPNKVMPWSGDQHKAGLFGQHLFSAGGKAVTVTEGEWDAMSVFQMFGQKYPAVSVKGGAKAALKNCKEQWEWLDSFEKIVICFDSDKPGQEAARQVAELFGNKAHIVKMSDYKDSNEYLVKGKEREFIAAWWNAEQYIPQGIVAGVDTWDDVMSFINTASTDYPWEGLNQMTRGYRPGELITITSGTGMGKSQLIRELEYDLLQRTSYNIGVLALEEGIGRAALGIMSVAANRSLHMQDENDIPVAREAWEATLGTGRYYLLDQFSGNGGDSIVSNIRYLNKGLGCGACILDHLSIIVSAQEESDERRALDRTMTMLKKLCHDTGMTLFVVCHLRRGSGTPHEEGGRVSLQDLRGSQAIAQLSDFVIGLERNQQHEDEQVRNTSTVRVLKNRFTGLTGPACYLYYDSITGRMVETNKPEDKLEEAL
jgi:twinkle protein